MVPGFIAGRQHMGILVEAELPEQVSLYQSAFSTQLKF